MHSISTYCSQTALFLLISIVLQLTTEISGLKGRISLHVDGNGFHRNLFYRVDLDGYNQENCHIALQLELPSDLYVDVDELAELMRIGVSTACSIGESDAELFAENAQPQNVTVCAALLSAGSILQLTLHQRYRYAQDGGGYVNITLPRPKLFLGCRNRVKGYRVSKINLCTPCVNLVPKWREIPFAMDGEEYIWSVPIGNSTLLTMIAYTTLLVTMLAALYVMRTVLAKPKPQEISKSD